jgi:hypothetical protein
VDPASRRRPLAPSLVLSLLLCTAVIGGLCYYLVRTYPSQSAIDIPSAVADVGISPDSRMAFPTTRLHPMPAPAGRGELLLMIVDARNDEPITSAHAGIVKEVSDRGFALSHVVEPRAADSSGRVVIDNKEGGYVLIWAPGFVSQCPKVDPTQVTVVRLEPALSLTLRLVDVEGKGVSGQRILVSRLSIIDPFAIVSRLDQGGGQWIPSPLHTRICFGVTNDKGEATIEPVSTGRHFIAIGSIEYLPIRGEDLDVIVPSPPHEVLVAPCVIASARLEDADRRLVQYTILHPAPAELSTSAMTYRKDRAVRAIREKLKVGNEAMIDLFPADTRSAEWPNAQRVGVPVRTILDLDDGSQLEARMVARSITEPFEPEMIRIPPRTPAAASQKKGEIECVVRGLGAETPLEGYPLLVVRPVLRDNGAHQMRPPPVLRPHMLRISVAEGDYIIARKASLIAFDFAPDSCRVVSGEVAKITIEFKEPAVLLRLAIKSTISDVDPAYRVSIEARGKRIWIDSSSQLVDAWIPQSGCSVTASMLGHATRRIEIGRVADDEARLDREIVLNAE